MARQLGWLGHVVVGMERQGYALSLTNITDDGWRATFHSNPQLSADGFATDDKPWRAVQRAAWEALTKKTARGPSGDGGVSGGSDRRNGRCRACGETKEVVALKRPDT